MEARISLNGQLSEYPLLTLFEIFDHKRATGRLDITCQEASGSFYFHSGELKIATMGKMKDSEALEFAKNL